jgi:hypothetical protein
MIINERQTVEERTKSIKSATQQKFNSSDRAKYKKVI